MGRKKIRKEYNSFFDEGEKFMQCKYCYNYEKVDINTVAVTCYRCVTRETLEKMPIEEFYPSMKKKGTGRPPGWHFMKEFVDEDGNVFHRGEEQLDLKGTLPPTKVKPRKKKKKLTANEKLLKRVNEYKSKKKKIKD